MASNTYPRTAAAELGGKHFQEHNLMYDAPAGIRGSDRRATPPDDAASNNSHKSGGRGSGQSANEEDSSEDDDEDSSAVQADDQDDEEDDADALAPSHGLGKGKGKRPAIKIQPVVEDESQEANDDDMSFHEAGLKLGKRPVTQMLMTNKKRSLSNLSNTSVLFGDDDAESSAFPRRKIARTLSNSGPKPLLKYKEDDHASMSSFENAIESDDEDYSGVNLVPEDDCTDVEDLEQEEESFIIQQEEQSAMSLISQHRDTRRLSLESCTTDNIFDITAPLDEAYLNALNLPDVGFGQFFEPNYGEAAVDPIAKRKYSDSSTKRVRFEDELPASDSSSSSSSELDSSFYPDLFLEQDKLPPSLYQLLENDNDEDNGDLDSPTSEASFWELGQDEMANTKTNGDDPFGGLSDSGSSGYETDLGDTTDEYDSDLESELHPQTPLQKKSVLKQPSSASGSKAPSPKPFERSSRPIGRAIPPTRGIFIHEDMSKAIAVTSRTTKKLAFYRPRASVVSWVASHGTQSSSNSTANNSPRASMQLNASDSEVSNDVFNNNNPFPADIMLTGIFGSGPTDHFLFGAESVGPPEAFYPFASVGADGVVADDDEQYYEGDSEDDLNIADFMDFGSDADATDADEEEEEEEEEEDETDIPATPATSMMAVNGSTPAHPTPAMATPAHRIRNASDAMLEHFDRGVVTAFRENQNRYRDLACLPSDPTIRASVSRPIRSGKSAETVMSPLRKRAMSKAKAGPSAINGSSPLSGVTKASSRLHQSMLQSRRPPRMGTFS